MGTRTKDTPRPVRRRKDNTEFTGMMRRLMRAHAARVGASDLEALADLNALRVDLDGAIGQAVAQLHAAGFSWADIGGQLGVTRAAAWQRYGQVSA